MGAPPVDHFLLDGGGAGTMIACGGGLGMTTDVGRSMWPPGMRTGSFSFAMLFSVSELLSRWPRSPV